MWNVIVNANCARASATASMAANMARRPSAVVSTDQIVSTRAGLSQRAACRICVLIAGSAGRVQQPPHRAFDLVILALAGVAEDDGAVLIDDVLRRPILVAPGVPGRRVVVLADRIIDAVTL